VILYEETLFPAGLPASSSSGASILDCFQAAGPDRPASKLDLAWSPCVPPGESWCTGLKGLRERAARAPYAAAPALPKWRACCALSRWLPSELWRA